MKSVIEVYVEIANKNPAWTPEEEKEVIGRLFYSDKDKFVNEAMKHYIFMVLSAVNKYPGSNKEDVFQSGMAAMVDALRKFDPKRGTRISTWLANPIRWAVMKYSSAYTKLGSISDEIAALNRRHHRSNSVISIDSPIGNNDDDGNSTVGDVISETNISINYAISRGISIKEDERQMEIHDAFVNIFTELKNILNEKEMFVLRGVLGGKNLSEVADDVGLSRVRVSQLFKSVVNKIKTSNFGKKLRCLCTPE